MKKIVILASAFFLFALGVKAQSASADYKEAIALLKDKGYSISTEQYAYLKEGETAYNLKTFYANLDYVVVAMSDDDNVNDVDIYLYDDDGSEYAKDADSKSVAVLTVSPLVTRDMKVVIKNYSSSTPGTTSKCRFVIAYK